MRKFFLWAAGLMIALTACQKEEMSMPDAGTASSFTVTIPQSGVQTRAVANESGTNEFGAGTLVNRCILEIYHNDKLYTRIEKDVTEKQVTFDNLRLVANQTYDFVFWADMAEGSAASGFTDRHYSTSNLKTIKNRGNFEGNSNECDAFFRCLKSYKVDKAFTESVTLKRPFGLLIVQTKDLNEIKDPTLVPTGYKVVFKDMYDTFDASTGTVSGSTKIEYTTEGLANDSDGTISMDFLWASEEEAALSDFEMTFFNNGTEICTNSDFKSIPIRRNYKTNVSGNLLTKKGTINVTIDPAFDGEPDGIPVDVDQVKTVDEANKAFESGKTNVIVTEAPTGDATLILPSTEAPVSATLPALTSKLKVMYSSVTDAQKPASFFLTTSSETAEVEIEAPNSTVTVSGKKYKKMTVSSSENTLVISEGTTVEELIVKKGNVAVYGTLNKIASKPNGTIVAFHASTAAKLQEFATALKTAGNNNIYNKVVLDADIDFKGAAFSIDDARGLVFDGQSHKLSNFKVENTQTAGLIGNAVSVTVSNLTVEGADVKANDDGKGNAYAGAIIGRSYGKIVFENVAVSGSKVEGVNKVGGMIGFVAENHVEATNCKVTDCTISNIDVTEESGQIGGFAGYLGLLKAETCSFVNCSVEDTEINAYMNREDRTISKFIGCFQGDQATDIVSIANCSVKRVTLNGKNDMAQSFLSTYGDLLGGQRYGNGTVNITNSPLTYSIASPAQLYKFAEMANKDNGKQYFSNATVQLDADIDLTGENWVPANVSKASKFIFDGQGHKISNMSAVNANVPGCTAGYGNGFIASIVSGSIRNVTFDKARLSRYSNSQYDGNCTGIVAGYAYATVTFENVHVTNSVINGFGKVGGILGMASDTHGITSFSNCSVTDTEIQGCYNGGGIIGLAQNLVTLKSCTVENVKWVPYPNEVAKDSYKRLDTKLTDKDGNLVTVQGLFWMYPEQDIIWYYPAFGDYYTDLYYDEMVTVTGENIAYGICHNK